MTEPIRIDVPHCDTKNRTIVDSDGHKITLTETYFRLQGWYVAEVYDEDKGMKVERTYDYDEVLLKKDVVSISLGYVNSEECYVVDIYSTNSEASIGINIVSKVGAQKYFDQIFQWWNP